MDEDLSRDAAYSPGKAVVLVDHLRDFEPPNCRIVGRAEMLRERILRRGDRRSDFMIEAFGDVRSMSAWARDPRCAVGKATLRRRILAGDAPEAAITTGPRTRGDARLPKKRGPKTRLTERRRIDWDRVVRLHRVEGKSPRGQ